MSFKNFANALRGILISAYLFGLTGQTIPKPGEDFFAASEDGIWTWYADPKAAYFEGEHKRTYMTWNNNNGDKEVAYYDHETEEYFTNFTPKMPYNKSDHNHPAIMVRPDGRILIFCTGHDGGEITELISVNPEDVTEWESPRYPGGDGGYCYPNVLFLEDEGDIGRVYLFFRDEYWEPWFCTSDDWGDTWSEKFHLFHIWTYPDNAYKPYTKYDSNGKDEIYMVIERQNRAGNSAVKPIYYAKYKDGAFYQADGELIRTMDELPMLDMEIDTVFYANLFGCSNTCYDVAADENGYPVIVFDMFEGQEINIYWYVRWTGSSWFKRPLINSGQYMGDQSGFAAGITLDHENPNIVYLARQILEPSGHPFNLLDTSYDNYKDSLSADKYTIVDPVHELDKWITRDGGSTWDTIPITRNSAQKNCRPCVPRGHKETDKVHLIWLNGRFDGMSDYDMAVRLYPYDEDIPPVKAKKPVSYSVFEKKPIKNTSNGISFILKEPSTSSLYLYDCKGIKSADLTSRVKTMNRGSNCLIWREAGVSKGLYIVRFFDGSSHYCVKTSVFR